MAIDRSGRTCVPHGYRCNGVVDHVLIDGGEVAREQCQCVGARCHWGWVPCGREAVAISGVHARVGRRHDTAGRPSRGHAVTKGSDNGGRPAYACATTVRCGGGAAKGCVDRKPHRAELDLVVLEDGGRPGLCQGGDSGLCLGGAASTRGSRFRDSGRRGGARLCSWIGLELIVDRVISGEPGPVRQPLCPQRQVRGVRNQTKWCGAAAGWSIAKRSSWPDVLRDHRCSGVG